MASSQFPYRWSTTLLMISFTISFQDPMVLWKWPASARAFWAVRTNTDGGSRPPKRDKYIEPENILPTCLIPNLNNNYPTPYTRFGSQDLCRGCVTPAPFITGTGHEMLRCCAQKDENPVWETGCRNPVSDHGSHTLSNTKPKYREMQI